MFDHDKPLPPFGQFARNLFVFVTIMVALAIMVAALVSQPRNTFGASQWTITTGGANSSKPGR
jgi:hypothetical protein